MQSTSGQGTRQCVSCGRSIANDANVCQFCGHDYRTPAAAAPHEKSALSMVGGIMILVAGVIGLAIGALLIAIDVDQLADYGLDVAGVGDILEDIMTVCGAILIILGLIAAVGGFFGLQRKHFGLVILGGVLGLFIVSPYMIASILSLIGLILVAISKKDFD